MKRQLHNRGKIVSLQSRPDVTYSHFVANDPQRTSAATHHGNAATPLRIASSVAAVSKV
jgi:hypothetical protein